LPAVVSASSLGLQLGLLAKPSGETLTITQAELAQRGIVDQGLLSIVYPNGETSTVIYTGKDLQTLLFSYSSGAFVGVQTVETRIVWTSVDKRVFYEQVKSVSELLGSIFGRDFKEGLLKSILLSSLTDSQALDVVNTLAKNVEWLKALSGEKRIDVVRKITDYVKKGETCDEAIEKAKRESEEYVKNIENDILAFYNSISDTQLANEALELVNCVKRNLGSDGYDAAKWLLDVLKRVYGEALASSGGNREVANSKLRSVVEKVFKYPESVQRNCMLATVTVFQLMRSEASALEETLRFENTERIVDRFKIVIPSSGYVRHGGLFEKGLYLIRAIRKEDGKIFEWSTKKEEANNLLHVRVPARLLKELVEKEVEIIIIKYDYSVHFKSRGSNFVFSPKDGLMVDGREIEIKKVEPQSWSERHGASMKAQLMQRSIYGAEISFIFYEDGDFRLIFKDGSWHSATLSTEGNLLIIECEGHKSIVPISVREWKEGEKYYLKIPLEGRERIKLVEELREVFGYYNVEALREKIKKGELKLVAYFDNARYATCGTSTLEINVPSGANVLEYIIIRSYLEVMIQESEEVYQRLKELVQAGRTQEYGDMVRDIMFGRMKDSGEVPVLRKKVSRDKIQKERPIPDTGRHVDIVAESEDGGLIVVEVKSTANLEDIETQYEKAWKQLKEELGYIRLIKEHGLEFFDEVRKDVNAYIIIIVWIDENTGRLYIEIVQEVPSS
jgi:hypothetical protein